MHRRDFIRHAAMTLPLLAGVRARAQTPSPKRLIIFYYPDGVPGRSQDGQPSAWHPTGNGSNFELTEPLSPLAPFKNDCLFFRGLQMGPTDEGSHPGGARKLLTAADHGNNLSLDRALAQSIGANDPHRHVYLGAMANHNGASGDKHISYIAPGTTVPPEDDPVRAFERLFGAAVTPDDPRPKVLDLIAADLVDLRARVRGPERTKLDLHLDALNEVQSRIQAMPQAAACADAPPAINRVQPDRRYEAEHLPTVLAAQRELMVQAMACGLTRVGVIQASHHTSELIMSRFPNTPLHTPNFDMRSHQASHYGPRHDPNHREYRDFVAQRRWFMSELAALLQSLRDRPEGDGTMLDHTLVLSCTEVCDGNVHDHRDMPFILAGAGQNGLMNTQDAPHGRLLLSIARTLGANIERFGTGDQPLW